jgi:hypothetical protein
MRSLEVILAESVGQMTPAQLAKWKKTNSAEGSVEAAINMANEILRESVPIRRNNGGTLQLSEAEQSQSAMQECDRILFAGMEKARSTAKGLSEMVESGGEYRREAESSELTEAQRADYDFCRLIGMSEADADKVARSNVVKGY